VVDDLIGMLSQQPSFRFVRDVSECREGAINAGYQVTGGEWFLPGHFPGNPIVPGVIQLAALEQAASVAALRVGDVPRLWVIEKARFPRLVLPGSGLNIIAVQNGDTWEGRIEAAGLPTCQASFRLSEAPGHTWLEHPWEAAVWGRSASSERLIELLPHRPPFRFVDEIEVCYPGKAVKAVWRAADGAPFLGGNLHADQVPEVIVLEALAQTAGVIVLSTSEYADRLLLFAGVEGVYFGGPARCSDQMELTVTMESLRPSGGRGLATAKVRGRIICQGRLKFVLAKR
jgi:3-hydroxyacyl-[acyl-carrier-protein] dehydratase